MMETNLYYDLLEDVYSNRCDSHRNIVLSRVTEAEIFHHLPDGVTMDKAIEEGWEETYYDECDDGAWWRYHYTVVLSDTNEGDEE